MNRFTKAILKFLFRFENIKDEDLKNENNQIIDKTDSTKANKLIKRKNFEKSLDMNYQEILSELNEIKNFEFTNDSVPNTSEAKESHQKFLEYLKNRASRVEK
jgi:hypothetical protein